MKVSALLASLSTALNAYSEGSRCGSFNNGLMCDPSAQYGPCCSSSGYCGNTTAYCAVENGCQSGCVKLPPPLPVIPPPGCGDGLCDGRTETCNNCPSDCSCNLKYLSKCQAPGQIALTFDDGPDQFAPNLLSIAKKLNVKLTLFVIGNKINTPANKNYLKQYYEAGHTIASHTFSHPFVTKLTDDQIREEMIKTDDAIFQLIGVRPIYMRNPYADSDKRAMALLDAMGYKSIFTTIDSEDTVYANSNPSKILSNTIAGLDSSPNLAPHVLTQHETFNASINYLPAIVNEIKHRNYTIVDLATCFGTNSPYRTDSCGDGRCTGYVENCQTCPYDCGKCPN